MQLEIVKLEDLSCEKLTVYSLYDVDRKLTLFEAFIQENYMYVDEIKSIFEFSLKRAIFAKIKAEMIFEPELTHC